MGHLWAQGSNSVCALIQMMPAACEVFRCLCVPQAVDIDFARLALTPIVKVQLPAPQREVVAHQERLRPIRAWPDVEPMSMNTMHLQGCRPRTPRPLWLSPDPSLPSLIFMRESIYQNLGAKSNRCARRPKHSCLTSSFATYNRTEMRRGTTSELPSMLCLMLGASLSAVTRSVQSPPRPQPSPKCFTWEPYGNPHVCPVSQSTYSFPA